MKPYLAMLGKSFRIIGLVFALFWMLFTFLEYWQYHEETRRAIQLFQYSELAIVLLVLGAVIVLSANKFRGTKVAPFLSNGLGILLLSGLLSLIIINAFFYKNLGSFLTLQEDLTFIGTLLGTGSATYFIILTAYSSGRLIGRIFDLPSGLLLWDMVNTGLGILLLVSLLFLLGIFGLLHNFVLWPLFILLLLLSWRSAIHFIKISLWKPIIWLNKLNAIGLSIGYLLLLLVNMNFIQVVRPFPTGFDAMTQYVNISSLINDYHGLVQGFGTYNWSLFTSLGYLLFNKTSVTLTLSFSGAVLSLVVLFQLSRKWLDANYSLLVMLLFFSMPMVGWLSYRDLKVDMGLLFFSLLIISLFYDWLQPKKKQNGTGKKGKTKKSKNKGDEILVDPKWKTTYLPVFIQEHPRMILIGLLTGFAIGIKISFLIFLLALLPAIAYAKGGKIAFGTSLSLVFFFVLAAKLDAQTMLRPLHLWADQLQWVFLLIALGLGAYFFIKFRKSFLLTLKLSVFCIAFSGLTISPWLVKNLIETKNLSVSSLSSGKSAHPKPKVEEIIKAYENQKDGK